MPDQVPHDDPLNAEPPEPGSPEFSSEDTIILEALGAGLTHAESAALAGVSTKTVQRRLERTAFASALATRRRQRTDEITGLLQGAGERAVRVLLETLDSVITGERLRAAHMILEQGRRFGMDARLDELNLRYMALRDQIGHGPDGGQHVPSTANATEQHE